MNKKGLSTIVTTLILVLLVLVAVGILWNPIKNILNQNTEAFDTTKCLTLDLKIKAEFFEKNNDGVYDDYTLSVVREDSEGEMAFVKLIYDNSTYYSDLFEPKGNWTEFKDRATIETENVTNGTIGFPLENATNVEVIPYFIADDRGEEVICESKDVRIFLQRS